VSFINNQNSLYSRRFKANLNEKTPFNICDIYSFLVWSSLLRIGLLQILLFSNEIKDKQISLKQSLHRIR